MTQDLFEKMHSLTFPKGKLGDLARWAAGQERIKTSDVVQWGVEHYYVSAIRSACLLAERGYLRRLTESEVGYETKQGVWVPTDLLRRLR